MSAILITLLPIVIPYGLQAVSQLIAMLGKAGGPTDADWQNLGALTQRTARSQMLETLQQHGIDPASAQGLAFLALVP